MLPELSAEQIGALERFRDLEIGFEELRRTLAPLVIYTMEPYRWRVEYKAGDPRKFNSVVDALITELGGTAAIPRADSSLRSE